MAQVQAYTSYSSNLGYTNPQWVDIANVLCTYGYYLFTSNVITSCLGTSSQTQLRLVQVSGAYHVEMAHYVTNSSCPSGCLQWVGDYVPDNLVRGLPVCQDSNVSGNETCLSKGMNCVSSTCNGGCSDHPTTVCGCYATCSGTSPSPQIANVEFLIGGYRGSTNCSTPTTNAGSVTVRITLNYPPSSTTQISVGYSITDNNGTQQASKFQNFNITNHISQDFTLPLVSLLTPAGAHSFVNVKILNSSNASIVYAQGLGGGQGCQTLTLTAPQGTGYNCSGSPNYQCTQAPSGTTGTYPDQSSCVSACVSPTPVCTPGVSPCSSTCLTGVCPTGYYCSSTGSCVQSGGGGGGWTCSCPDDGSNICISGTCVKKAYVVIAGVAFAALMLLK